MRSAPVEPANLNSPEQTVISGATAAVERAIALAKERGAKRAVLLQVSAPFHCSLMQPAQDGLAPILQEIPFCAAKMPVVVNVDANTGHRGAELRDALNRQVTGAVPWTESMQLLIAEELPPLSRSVPARCSAGCYAKLTAARSCVDIPWKIPPSLGRYSREGSRLYTPK